MGKLRGELSYKDWCILKHVLQESVKIKELHMKSDEFTKRNFVGYITNEELNKNRKELEEEKRTLERITEIIDGFKEYIRK